MHGNEKAVLEEHLPYELNMLEAAYEFLQRKISQITAASRSSLIPGR